MRIIGKAGVLIYKTTPEFWVSYRNLSQTVQQLADEKFQILKSNPRHPSLNLKKIGRYWAARVGTNYRALAREENGDLVWFWIGKHDEYMRILQTSY